MATVAMRDFWRARDAYFGLAKAFCFGLTITTIGCYQGFKVPPGSGAEGVGHATTNTVVVSCLMILVFVIEEYDLLELPPMLVGLSAHENSELSRFVFTVE